MQWTLSQRCTTENCGGTLAQTHFAKEFDDDDEGSINDTCNHGVFWFFGT